MVLELTFSQAKTSHLCEPYLFWDVAHGVFFKSLLSFDA